MDFCSGCTLVIVFPMVCVIYVVHRVTKARDVFISGLPLTVEFGVVTSGICRKPIAWLFVPGSMHKIATWYDTEGRGR